MHIDGEPVDVSVVICAKLPLAVEWDPSGRIIAEFKDKAFQKWIFRL